MRHIRSRFNTDDGKVFTVTLTATRWPDQHDGHAATCMAVHFDVHGNVQDLGDEGYVMGASITIMCIAEVPIFARAEAIAHWLGGQLRSPSRPPFSMHLAPLSDAHHL